MRLPALSVEQLKELFPRLARLADSGNDGAESVLDVLSEQRVQLYDTQVRGITESLEYHESSLFPERFGNQEIFRTRVQFEIEDHVTIVYEISDNNYAACGISFQGNRPKYLHVNDRTYPLSLEGSHFAIIVNALDMLTQFLAEEDNRIPLHHSMTGTEIIPPIVDCRLGLDPDDHPREVAVMSLVRTMVHQRSPQVADILFTSEVPGYDINTGRFALRTYNRHAGDYTHTWNFVWRDFAVQWYGRINRSPTFNRELTQEEVIQLLSDVREDLQEITWGPVPESTKQMTPESLQRVQDKFLRNARSGAYGEGDASQWQPEE